MIQKGYRYRIYPNGHQRDLIEKHLGATRWIYNWGLEQKIRAYKASKITISCFDLIKGITILRQSEDTKWLKEVSSCSLQQSLRHLDNAYTKFFRAKKGFPKFKSKKLNKQSFSVLGPVSKVNFDKNLLTILKIANIKIIIDRPFIGKIKTVTVSRKNDKYFASILVETPVDCVPLQQLDKNTAIGIDLGLRDFATLSSGEKISNPRFLEQTSQKLKFAQRICSRRVKGSNRKEKAKKRVASIYGKVTNQRSDFLHKLSTKLICENQTICLENLNVNGMLKNHKLARSISDVSWSEFVRQLAYKSKWYGINLLFIGRFEPSSKICNKCGWYNSDLKLGDTTWTCNSCKSILDRDINASLNIRDFAFHKQNLVGQELPELTLRE